MDKKDDNMKKINLNGKWQMFGGEYNTSGEIPGSVYSILLNNGLMEDPFYRDNEAKALEIIDNEFVFVKKFDYQKKANKVFLVCEGVDTVSDVYLNGEKIGHTENMHRKYSFDVSKLLKNGQNEIKFVFPPIDKWIKDLDKDKNIAYGTCNTLKGFMHVRKAHCMFGWDWGPKLPDAGIWKDIYLQEMDEPCLTDIRILQNHDKGRVYLRVDVKTSDQCDVKIQVVSPNGDSVELENGIEKEIINPLLWWPNGYGKQNLYKVICQTVKDGKVTDENIKKIGLRTLDLIKEKDEWGESFYHRVNGVNVFAMGADYIPEDSILSRCNRERTEKLLKACVDANFNAIRVWGGGYYPNDYFFDLCDELGIMVFFDLMFACSAYPFGEEFTENVIIEIRENLTRIRHHACLAIIAGNNEIEEEIIWWDESYRPGYLDLFEKSIPEELKKVCPEIPYVPSSPSSFGGMNDPGNENYGDCHYWDVWFKDLPFTEYRKHYFRYLSEFGFQSFPTMKTIEGFTLPEDRNPFTVIMELHQRHPAANGKILNYLSQNYLYPTRFETLVYASQLLQAEAIKCAVEHLRRNRGRCMGTLYWQLNDIWPVASWSSIDCNGRYKALHYQAKRFYEPIHISCVETGEYTTRRDITQERIVTYETKAEIFVNNETLFDIDGEVIWKLMNAEGAELLSGKENLSVKALSVGKIDEIDFNKTDVRNNYLWFAFKVDGNIVSEGSVIFTKAKYFRFVDPNLSVEINGDEITVKSKAYAKYVEIYDETGDLILSDNFFDMNKGERKVKVLSGNPKGLKARSVFDIR